MPLYTERFQCFSKDFFFFNRNLSIEYQVQFRGQIRGRENPSIPEKQLTISESLFIYHHIPLHGEGMKAMLKADEPFQILPRLCNPRS